MSKSHESPWASGPGEILRHGLDLLKRDTDTNRRLAMISIDNAVELMIKTYLGLPKRVTGLTITRREFGEISESFPSLLDALEKHAPSKLDGIDLGTIEWYHRLRNELYHQGNGLTVERDQIEIYAELSNLLFKNLFGSELVSRATAKAALLGEFLNRWISLERGMRETASRHSFVGRVPSGVIEVMRFLRHAGLLEARDAAELEALRRIRNEVVHGAADVDKVITSDVLKCMTKFVDLFGHDGEDGASTGEA